MRSIHEQTKLFGIFKREAHFAIFERETPNIILNQPYQGYASISFKAIGGINYAIQRSIDLSTWQNAQNISGSFSDITLNDPLDLTNRVFYRVMQY